MENNKNFRNITKKDINELQEGMKIARDIVYEFGGVFLPRGSFLNKHKIDKLQELSFEYIYVYNESEKQIKENYERIQKGEYKYKYARDHMQNIFKRTRNKKDIKYEEIKELTYQVTTMGNDQDIISLLSKVREADLYTYSHSINVGMLAYMFGNWLELSNENIIKLTQAGFLHDIGKAYISDDILNKPGKLSDDEYEIMKKHSIYGYEMLKENKHISKETAQGVLTHHERYNGSGYPFNIKGKKIPFFGRILGIVDTFDAITAERIYKPGCSPFEAIKLFHEEIIGVFDYKLVQIFLNKIPNYFVKEEVKLNDGRSAEVIFINPRHPNKPIIKVGGNYIDLYNNFDIEIEKLL